MGSLNWASGLIPLGHLHFHSLGLTNRFSTPRHSDPVTLLRQWQDLSFLTSGIPISPFQAEFTISRTPRPRAGAPTWGFSDCGCMDPFRTRAPHQCTGAQGSNIGPPSLGYSITGPSCFDCYRQYHCCNLHQQTRWNPFPPPVAAGSGSVSVATDYKSQTHSGLPKCNSRPVVLAEPAHHERVESPPRSNESDIQTVGNSSSGHVCHSPKHASSPVHMCLVPEPRALVIDSLSQD